MSTASKQQLLRNIGKKLESELTVTQLNAVLASLADEMELYNIDVIEGVKEGFSFDLMTEFINAKVIEGKSPRTIDRYQYFLNRIIEEIGVPINRITVYHLRQYLMNERNRGISESTLNGYRSIMCSFFNWLQRESLIQQNPTANLGQIKVPKVVREPYSDVEIERLKSACKTTRDVAIVTFLLSTGCRISEVVSLNRDDINFASLDCKVLGKGNKERIVYLDPIAAMYLKRYLAERTDDDPALFYSRNHARITVGGVQLMLRVLEQDTGIPNVHPHRFRRTLATNLINHGMPIQEVAHVLGHEKIDTTMRYVYIESENVRAAYKRYS